MIKAKSQFKQRSTANNVEIVIPVPADADTPSFKTSIGSVKYAPERDAIVWLLRRSAATVAASWRGHHSAAETSGHTQG